MKIVLYACFTIFYFGFVHSTENYNALFFDRLERSLIKLPNKISNDDAKSGKWASVCPAESNEDDNGKYNENKSFSKNALFVRNIYTEEDLSKILGKKRICNKPVRLSVAVSFEGVPIYHEFGYEIHFKPSESINYTTSSRGKYKSIEDTLKLPNPLEYLDKRSALVKTIGRARKNEEKDFMWIPLFKVISRKKQLRKIEYEIRRNNVHPIVKCQDYSLGHEIYEGVNVDELYSLKAQKTAFRSVDLPSHANEECKSSFACFEKALLIPSDQFRFGSIIPKCSNMTTVPIWSSAVKGILEKVDKYLYTLSRISGRPLHITAGVRKNLHYRTRRTKQLKFILLKGKKSTLHVPKIIYKMVKLKLRDTCEEKDSTPCWSGILIVIHNHPNFDITERICADKSEQIGWEEIKYSDLSTQGTSSENIYVCSIEKETMAKMGLKYNEKLPVSELSLKSFPYNKNGTEVNDKDMKTQLLDELKRLAQGGKIKITSNLIKRPFFGDENFIETTEIEENVSESVEDEEEEEEEAENETEIDEEEEEEEEETEEDEEEDEGTDEKEKDLDDENEQDEEEDQGLGRENEWKKGNKDGLEIKKEQKEEKKKEDAESKTEQVK